MPSLLRRSAPIVKDMVMELALNNGITMPALGLGVFQSPPDETTAAVRQLLTM